MTRLDTPPSTLRAWLGLLVILGPVLLVAMDGSVLFLAMPAITDALTPTADQSLWILDSYGFAVGSLLIWFVRRQFRITHPLIDFGLFRSPVFTIAIVTGFLPLAAWSATAYLASTYLQSVLGLTVARAALLAVPGAVVLTVAAVATPAVVARIGQSAALIGAHFAIAAGLFLLLFAGDTGGAGWYIASTAVAGIGYGISFSVVADIAVAAVPPERAGSAAALAETGNELGNAFGIAVFGSLAALLFRLHGPDLAPTLGETLHLPALAPVVLADARAAFVGGLHVVAVTAGLLHAALGLLAVRVLRRSAEVGHSRGRATTPPAQPRSSGRPVS